MNRKKCFCQYCICENEETINVNKDLWIEVFKKAQLLEEFLNKIKEIKNASRNKIGKIR